MKEKEIYQHCKQTIGTGNVYFCRLRINETTIFNAFPSYKLLEQHINEVFISQKAVMPMCALSFSVYVGNSDQFIRQYEANNHIVS